MYVASLDSWGKPFGGVNGMYIDGSIFSSKTGNSYCNFHYQLINSKFN